jgi:hypothetical protein
MSKRAADMLREDMEYMGPIREKDRDEAQLKILTIIRHLEDCGEILVPKPGQDCYVEESQVNPSYKEKDFNLISGFSDDHVLSALNYLNNAHEAIQSGDFDLDYIQSARYKSLICSPPLLFNKLTLDKNWFEKWKIKRRIKKSYIYDIVEILEARETISKYIKNFIPSNNSETKEKANG